MNLIQKIFFAGFSVGASTFNVVICVLAYGLTHSLLFAIAGLFSTIGAVVQWNIYTTIRENVVIKEGEPKPDEPKQD